MEKQSTLYRYSPVHTHCLHRRPHFVILSVALGSTRSSPVHAHCLHRRPRFVILSAAEGSTRSSPMHAYWH